MLESLRKMLAAKEARREKLANKAAEVEDIAELRGINSEILALNDELTELRGLIAQAEEQKTEETDDEEFRSEKPAEADVIPEGILKALGTFRAADHEAEERAKKQEEVEKRGKDLKEGRAVTVGSHPIVLPKHDSATIRPTFAEASGLIDRVSHLPLHGGESFVQPYLVGYGVGEYTGEGEEYATTETEFDYAEINKSKVTAYAEITEELEKLPAAQYDREVMKGVSVASRKKITREILIGKGGTNQLVGIFSDKAEAIDPETDKVISEIDDKTLDEIVFSYGGDEEVEDPAVLILNKLDLKAFAQLRSTDGKRIHDVKTNGNTGTIDGVPFLINSMCGAISNEEDTRDYCMAYGPLSNYLLAIFSDVDVRKSDDFMFKQGMSAFRSSVFIGGNVVSKNGFLRIKKNANP